jgi:hypothetical protein
MQMPKFNIKDFLTFPVILVAGLGAIGTLLQWSGRSIISQDDVHSAQIAASDSVQREILKTLTKIEATLAAEGLINEAQLRGECLENDLEMLARQGLLNACQDRNLLIGRAITPSVAAAASAAPALSVPVPARPDSLPN